MEEQGLALLRATTLSSVRPLSLWLRVQPDSRVGSRREDPRLCGVKDDIQDAQVPGDIVSSENFDRHNERILQEVTAKRRETGQKIPDPANRACTQQTGLRTYL